jgi:hypothetical protein
MRTYACAGNVRGNCGHKHRTIKAAHDCFQADYRDCERAGGYSDRSKLRVYEDGEPVDPTQDEIEEWQVGCLS